MPHETAFQIHVAGSLTPRMIGWFEGLAVEHGPDGNDVLLTPPIDQAELRGLLTVLFNMNVPVIAVMPRGRRRVSEDGPPEPRVPAQG